MDRTEQVILTNMCMVYDGNRVLVEEKIDSSQKGIIFPGGHIEMSEPIVDSVIREIFEETGLTIEKPRLCGVKDFFTEDGYRYIVYLFKTDTFSGELHSSDEGRVFWTTVEELPKLNLIYHMDSMLRIFLTDEYSELFFDNKVSNSKPILK